MKREKQELAVRLYQSMLYSSTRRRKGGPNLRDKAGVNKINRWELGKREWNGKGILAFISMGNTGRDGSGVSFRWAGRRIVIDVE